MGKGLTFTLTWQKALAILAFFGITSYGGLMLTLRAGALWLVGPAINAHADTLATQGRAWADSAMKAGDKAVMDSVMRRMGKLEELLMDVPAVREQQEKKARERKQKVRRRVEWIETLND
jgi:hypothetical protein